MRRRESWEYKTQARIDRQQEQERRDLDNKLNEYRLQQWAELRYWVAKRLERGVEVADVIKQLGLTIQGYDLLMTTDDRALHPMTISNANARVKAYELRYNEGFSVFAMALIASKTGW